MLTAWAINGDNRDRIKHLLTFIVDCCCRFVFAFYLEWMYAIIFWCFSVVNGLIYILYEQLNSFHYLFFTPNELILFYYHSNPILIPSRFCFNAYFHTFLQNTRLIQAEGLSPILILTNPNILILPYYSQHTNPSMLILIILYQF